MCTQHVCLMPTEPCVGVRTPGTEITDVRESSCGRWEAKPRSFAKATNTLNPLFSPFTYFSLIYKIYRHTSLAFHMVSQTIII